MEKIKINLTGSTMYSDYSAGDSGYSTASHRIYETLEQSGFEMSKLDHMADINISFAVPYHHIMLANCYNILYSAHETTEISKDWAWCLNKGDEIWATSSWTAKAFAKIVDKPVRVVPHGIGGRFIPAKRKDNGVFAFLHIGEPYIRKGGQVTVEAFIEEFGEREDIMLIIKAYPQGHTILVDDGTGKMLPPERLYKNIKVIKDSLSFSDYLKLLHNTHCLVYPSWGEGFGMIPLECMGTGMPVISSWEWAEYKDLIKHKIDSDIVPVPNNIPRYLKDTYFGTIYQPQKESIRKLMREVYENREKEFEESASLAIKVHKEWNWEDVLEKYAIPRLKEIAEGIK